ncbi:MAG: nitroreductase family protein [Eubacteriales bacterium]|nr:nitroreductase family protein [Eubacteriales bacterium]
MEFYEVINNRRTIREFEVKPIPQDVLSRILDAGLKAPSSDHLRQWAPVALTERETIEAVAKEIHPLSCHIQKPVTPQQEMFKIAFPKQQSMLAEAGCLLLPYFKQSSSLYKPENVFTLIHFGATWALIENMLLAATAEGLGCAIHIPVGEETSAIQKILGAAKDYVLPALIAVGYPAPDAQTPTQVSATVAEKVHWNRW